MADLSVTGEVVVTSEKAEAAFDRVGDKATQMANEVASSAGKAGQAVDGIGAGVEKSAEKFTRAESRMRDAIKRSTQELQLLGKTASEKLEFNINAKGLDASKFAPYIEELKKAEAAQRIATGSLDKMGISAAQTAAALRGVPAQFTDIITSLQGGQAPLTVFLQQGGQLKDMFGGAGAAARALGGYVVGLINPFTLAAAGAAALAVAYNQGSKEADAYRLAMVGTGNAAGTTAGQLKSYAQEISGVVGTQGKAAESLAAFVSTGRVSRDVLKEASQAAIAWERATGQAVGTTAKQFADLGKDPLQAVLKLNEGTNFLTESVYRQIKSLEEQGRTAEAAAVAQRAYADALTGRSGEIERNLGSIETAWNKVKDAAKAGWDAILNVGRAESNQDRLAATRKQIADLENRLAAGSGFTTTAGGAATGRPDAANNDRLRAELMGLKAKEAALFGVASAEQAAAEAQAERAKQTQAATEWDKAGTKYLTDKAKLERELTKARNEGLAAGKSQAEIEQRLAQIRESYAKKGGGSAASENKELRERQRIYAELVGVSSTYYNDLAAAQEQRAKGNLSEAEYVKYVETLIQKQPFAVAQEKERAEAIKESAKAAAESSKALSAWYEVREKESQGLQNQINARREEVSMMGMTTEAVIEYTRAKFEQQAAEKEAYAAALESASFYAGEYAEAYKTAAEAARQQAKQLRELGGLEVEKANKDAAKKAAQEWERAAADIERALTDSLLRGFESGKDFAKNMRDTVVNMFKTMVLRPVISAVMSPISGAINGAVSGAAGSAGGGMLSSMGGSVIGNALGGVGAFGIGASYGATSLFANGLGATLSAGSSMIGAGSVMSGLGTIAGALGPIALGVAALYAIVSSLDDSGTYHSGAGAIYSADQGLQEGAGIYNQSTFRMGDVREYNKDVQPLVSGIAAGLGTALDGVAVAFGQKAGYEIATAFADDTSEDGAWGALRISKEGQELLNWQDTRTSRWAPREFGDGEGGYKEYLAAVAKDTQQVLLDMDLPGWADTVLQAIGDSPSIESLSTALTQIGQAQAVFESFGQYMTTFATLADSSVTKLAAASGGIGALAGNMSVFVDQFYTDAEKLAVNTENLSEAMGKLGFELPTTRDEFKALVQAQLALGDAGAETAAGLLAVSGAFAQLQDAASALRSAVGGAFDQLAQSLNTMRDDVADADARVAASRMAIWQGYNDAQQKVIDLEMQAAEATRSFAQSLRSFIGDMATGPQSSMGLESRYRTMQQQLEQTAAQAGAGDQGARDRLTGVASSYLDAARARSSTSVDYARDAARVRVMLGNLASTAEADPLVQKYDAESLTIQQQIADAQIDVVKYLALMEATGTSTDLGIQTVDKTLSEMRDEYIAAEQAQAAANLKLDVALAALDALGLTESLVNAIAANQTSSLSGALNISDEALGSITGALGLTPENVAELGQQFAVEVALLVGQAATDLASTLQSALAFDPSVFDALRTVVGYDTASPDFAALQTILGFDLESEKFRALGTILGLAPGASAQVDALLGGISFTGDAAAHAETLAQGVSFTSAAVGNIEALTAGVDFAPDARQSIAQLAAGIAWTNESAALASGLNAGVGWAGDVGAQVDGLNAGIALTGGASEQVNALLAGLTLSGPASEQVDGLLDGLKLAAADRVTIERMLVGIGFDTDTAAALHAGLGLQDGLLSMLGSALGLSADAVNAIGVLSGIGTIDQVVRSAYSSIGRSGIGSGVNQIDQGGYDYWTAMLSSGRVSQEDFLPTFLQNAADDARRDEDYAALVGPYLKKLGIPGFAVGTNYVPYDMVAQIHEGEAIVPKAYNPAAGGGGGNNAEMVAELRAMRAELAELRAIKSELAAINRSSSTTATGMTGIVNKQVSIVTEAA